MARDIHPLRAREEATTHEAGMEVILRERGRRERGGERERGGRGEEREREEGEGRRERRRERREGREERERGGRRVG